MLIVVLLVGVLFFYLNKPQEVNNDQPSKIEDAPSPAVSQSSQEYRDYSAPQMKGYGDPDTIPEKDMLILDQLLTSYILLLKGGNSLPLGENRETTAALLGENKYRTRLLSPDSPWINDNKELVDRWGTPVFFHGISNDLIGIRSAGKDKVMWTEDDVTNNENAGEYSSEISDW